jgi:hypothetical protein
MSSASQPGLPHERQLECPQGLGRLLHRATQPAGRAFSLDVARLRISIEPSRDLGDKNIQAFYARALHVAVGATSLRETPIQPDVYRFLPVQ